MSPTASEVFRFFLEAADLKGQSHALTIQGAAVEEVWDPRLKHKVPSIVVQFERAKKVLKLNKTQCQALITISGTDDYQKWSGVKVILTPARTPNNQDTIVITAQPLATDQQ